MGSIPIRAAMRAPSSNGSDIRVFAGKRGFDPRRGSSLIPSTNAGRSPPFQGGNAGSNPAGIIHMHPLPILQSNGPLTREAQVRSLSDAALQACGNEGRREKQRILRAGQSPIAIKTGRSPCRGGPLELTAAGKGRQRDREGPGACRRGAFPARHR